MPTGKSTSTPEAIEQAVGMDGVIPETCAECGFDARDWRVRDAVTLLDALGEWWAMATDGISSAELNARPAPGVWSALEYGVHSAFVTAVVREGIQRILSDDGVRLPDPPEAPDATPDDAVPSLDGRDIVGDLAREGHALAELARGATGDAWHHSGSWSGGRVDPEAALFHVAHDATHHMMDVGRGLAAIGAGAPRRHGAVVQVNLSDGGVPKRAVSGGRIGWRGLDGDRQSDGKHHGRPFQALCLWSSDVLGALVADGHPIGPGLAGENVTLSGVDWTALRPGTRLRIGSVLAELSFPATPCAKQAQWFSDGDFARISYERNPHWVRWYAWVREPGDVRSGDAAVVSPPA